MRASGKLNVPLRVMGAERVKFAAVRVACVEEGREAGFSCGVWGMEKVSLGAEEAVAAVEAVVRRVSSGARSVSGTRMVTALDWDCRGKCGRLL